jgi:leucine dehydrogenase
MPIHVLEAMAREGFEEVVALHDARSGLRGFLGIHESRIGPAFGGIRRWTYRDEDHALLDCLRLSRAMTYKCALAGLRAGGAKLVVLDRPDLDREAAYRRIGDAVESFAGRFYTGPDVGTTARDLSLVAERTSFVTRPGADGPGELSDATSEGIVAGIAACLRHLDGEEDWPRRTIVVQGLGGIGQGVARRLLSRGARVVAAELDPDRADQATRDLDLELVDPASELDQACDVFAPCALGGILHDLSIARLRCRIVAGGANNVLARSAHGDRLHARGILYAPDIAITAGALIRGALFHLEGRREAVAAIGQRIGGVLAGILDRAREEERPTSRVARDLADERLDAARRSCEEARGVPAVPTGSAP